MKIEDLAFDELILEDGTRTFPAAIILMRESGTTVLLNPLLSVALSPNRYKKMFRDLAQCSKLMWTGLRDTFKGVKV
jgi:hypothetical protein